jgi:hypothetical protein
MREKRVIIHIGMPKTGTSSIQENFARYFTHDNIEKTDALYAPFKQSNHGGVICTLFGGEKHLQRFHLSKKRERKKIEEIKKKHLSILKETLSLDISSIIISGEAIGTLQEPHLEQMKSYFEQFATVEIVAYVRSPYSYISSAFQQILKKNRFQGFDLRKSYPQYHKRFKKFDKVFGEDRVKLFLFDPKRFHQGDVVLDFAHKLSLPFPFQSKKFNESLSLEAVKLLYLYKKHYPHLSDRENHALIHMLQEIGETKFTLSPSIIKPIVDRHHRDISWIERRVGLTVLDKVKEKPEAITTEKELLTLTTKELNYLQSLLNTQTDNLEELLPLLRQLVKKREKECNQKLLS